MPSLPMAETPGPAMAAVEMAREKASRSDFSAPSSSGRFPTAKSSRWRRKVKKILVCELNIDGQLVREVARASKGKAEVIHLGSGGVEPHLPVSDFQRD